jgi:hypothetical protein
VEQDRAERRIVDAVVERVGCGSRGSDNAPVRASTAELRDEMPTVFED